MSAIEDLIEEFKKAFYECHYSRLCSIHSTFMSLVEETPKLSRKLDFMEYSRFKSELEYADLCFSYIDSSNWEVVSNSKGILVECRGGGNEFCTRCTVDINSSLFRVLCVLSEPDLVKTWVDILKQVDVYSCPTMTRKLIQNHYSFPWPVSDRHCMLEFNAIPVPNRRASLITMRSPTSENYLNFKIPPPNNGQVRMWVRVGCIYAQFVDTDKTKVIFMVNSDMNIALLPNFLINFGAKHIMHFVMKKLRKNIMNFEGSTYESRVREKPDFYDYIKKTISEYI